jgi:hypothetical protein
MITLIVVAMIPSRINALSSSHLFPSLGDFSAQHSAVCEQAKKPFQAKPSYHNRYPLHTAYIVVTINFS